MLLTNFYKGTYMNNHTKVTYAFMKIWCISPNWMWEIDTGILENAGLQQNSIIHFSLNSLFFFFFLRSLEDEIKLRGLQRQGYKPLIDHKLSPLTSVDHFGCVMLSSLWKWSHAVCKDNCQVSFHFQANKLTLLVSSKFNHYTLCIKSDFKKS